MREKSILDARTGALRATWPYHGALAISDQTSHIFVCSTTTGFMRPAVVHMLDARTGVLLRTVGVGPGGCALAVAVRTARVFVTSDDGRVRVLDARTGALLRTVAGGSRAIAVAARAGHVFVGDNILDARTGAVVRTAELVGGPIDITVDDRTNRVFVTLQDGESAGDPTFGLIDVLDAGSGALIHSAIVHTWPVSVPIVNPLTGHVVVLLRSPQDVRTAQVSGPGSLLVLDGSTGAIRRSIDPGAVMTFGIDDVVTEDAHAKRLFVLNENATDMFDAARL